MNGHVSRAGGSPLLVSIPHAGTALTDAVAARLTDTGARLPDTDWHVPRLYGFLDGLDASVIEARYSRYVVDLNRPPDDEPLYSGPTTGLFPQVTFDGEPLFRPGAEPGPEARRGALDGIWHPYHRELADMLAAIRRRHGYAILFDAHSIRSMVPRLFEGRLPDLNVGTAGGASCAASLGDAVAGVCADSGYSSVVNGRFRGGYITRAYGAPADGIHAVQLELAQCNYMEESPPFAYRPERAAQLQPVLRRVLETLLAWRP
jgi:N-formylglutamate amidohydrolase